MKKEQLTQALKTIAERHWNNKKVPLLLSEVPPALADELHEDDYRSALEGKSLKNFIRESGEANGYRLVEHASQRAKVGLAPSNSDFEYVVTASEKPPKKIGPSRKEQNKVLELLDILSTLPQIELDKITIPVSSLVKLLK